MVQYIYTLGAAGERLDIAELDFEGNVRAYYTIGADLISQELGGRTYTYLYDGHGSVVGLMSEDGTVTDTYTYDAFGNLLKSTGRTANNYRYCGEQFDSTTGLYYLRARYMDTSTGRFISQDSYAGSVYDPVSLHKYLYANSNPVMYIDPSGYEGTLTETQATMAMSAIISSIIVPNYLNIFRMLTDGLIGLANAVNDLFDDIEDLIADISSGATNSTDVNRGGIVESFPLGDEPPVIIEIFPRTDESELSNIESLPLPNNDDVTWTEGISVGTPEPYVESFPLSQENGIKIFYINNTSEATRKANSLGYRKTNYISHGQAVYYNSKNKTYITLDKDSHNGGVWKMAKSPNALESKQIRMGTYDENLNRIGD